MNRPVYETRTKLGTFEQVLATCIFTAHYDALRNAEKQLPSDQPGWVGSEAPDCDLLHSSEIDIAAGWIPKDRGGRVCLDLDSAMVARRRCRR